MDDNNVSDSEHAFNSSPTEPANVDAESVGVDIYDPANWASLDNKARDWKVFNEAACLLNILIVLPQKTI
jgi:hypothetical protein